MPKMVEQKEYKYWLMWMLKNVKPKNVIYI